MYLITKKHPKNSRLNDMFWAFSSFIYYFEVPQNKKTISALSSRLSLTILRKNEYFAQSNKGIEVLCGLQSIWETGKHYGIDDIACWLIECTRELAVYCESKAWTQEAEKGRVLDNPSR